MVIGDGVPFNYRVRGWSQVFDTVELQAFFAMNSIISPYNRSKLSGSESVEISVLLRFSDAGPKFTLPDVILFVDEWLVLSMQRFFG
ncbi:hypothetical protein [Planctomicrobium sp. SH527]|uniref:hypothetical protein n=1 Tax=Planctomicrobium sp. SH527 TaxID=3448123 RepID=UPI003F5C68A7